MINLDIRNLRKDYQEKKAKENKLIVSFKAINSLISGAGTVSFLALLFVPNYTLLPFILTMMSLEGIKRLNTMFYKNRLAGLDSRQIKDQIELELEKTEPLEITRKNLVKNIALLGHRKYLLHSYSKLEKASNAAIEDSDLEELELTRAMEMNGEMNGKMRQCRTQIRQLFKTTKILGQESQEEDKFLNSFLEFMENEKQVYTRFNLATLLSFFAQLSRTQTARAEIEEFIGILNDCDISYVDIVLNSRDKKETILTLQHQGYELKEKDYETLSALANQRQISLEFIEKVVSAHLGLLQSNHAKALESSASARLVTLQFERLREFAQKLKLPNIPALHSAEIKNKNSTQPTPSKESGRSSILELYNFEFKTPQALENWRQIKEIINYFELNETKLETLNLEDKTNYLQFLHKTLPQLNSIYTQISTMPTITQVGLLHECETIINESAQMVRAIFERGIQQVSQQAKALTVYAKSKR